MEELEDHQTDVSIVRSWLIETYFKINNEPIHPSIVRFAPYLMELIPDIAEKIKLNEISFKKLLQTTPKV